MSKRRAESSSGSGSGSGSSSSSSSSSESDAESGLVTSPKKRQRTGVAASNSPPKPVAHDSDSETSDSDDDWDASGKKKKPKKKKAKLSSGKPNRKPSSDNESHSDPEEGEVSDNSDSDDGARKSGSSSSYSSSESEEEFNDGYDENLMGDDNDQARLASMTEKEREEELFNRNERREVMRTRFEIEKKLKAAKRKEQHKKKSSHKGKKDNKDKGLSKDWGDKDLDKDVKERSKERKKTVEENKGKTDKKAQAMTALKARREEKKEREEKEKQRIEDRKNDDKDGDLDGVSADANKKKLKASDVYSDDSGSDSDSGSDFSTDKHGAAGKSSFPSSSKRQQSSSSSSSSDSDEDDKKSSKAKKPVFVESKEQLGRIRLSRHRLEKWVHAPFLKRAIVGCFVRVGIGMNNGRSVYRIAEIIDVCETGKIYQLGSTKTNKGIRLKHGAQERVFRIEFVSNQDFSDSEFKKWLDDCNTQGTSPPTLEDIEKKLKDIKEAANFEFNEEDINQMLEEKGRFRKTPYNYAMRKNQLMKERDVALLKGEEEETERITKELAELEERADELSKRSLSTTLSSISFINERNRKRNVERAEEAILEEIRASGGQKTEDPFTRRSTRPGKSGGYRPNADGIPPGPDPLAPVIKTESQSATANNEGRTDSKDKAKLVAKPKTSDLFSAHDFDIKIDLEVPLQSQPVAVTPKPVANLKEAPRRSLNLEDYKKKRGLI
ncbi:RNA polymerase-associated protein Rtf1-like [Daphnia pulex]|uniref:RNA polymerase-associated protein Rtf1-like n=1 Tax=Daphnia pulex TaxID=6669 RepID=UPI001EE06694|nr:RNA polymerase-associated protein Rtf1-like [Daphnia pulex]XP_046639865.1 RNA polymerase-associated protein Rtf1-like [Daphnia pulicaria]